MNADRANAYLNDPLIQAFEKQMQDAIYSALENANERDQEHLKNLCLMAKQRKQFMGYLRSFIDTEKMELHEKKTGVIDSIASFVARKTQK